MTKLEVNVFSSSSIAELQRKLETYEKTLSKKCETFTKRLAEEGIEVAKSNTGEYGSFISFSIKSEQKLNGYKTLLVATNTGTIVSQWQTKEGIKTANVSPLLMAEFGSGFRAENPKNVSGVGQGTFPLQKHAFDTNGWHWQDLDGYWHHSYGIAPTMPMYKASVEMFNKIERVAKEVF